MLSSQEKRRAAKPAKILLFVTSIGILIWLVLPVLEARPVLRWQFYTKNCPVTNVFVGQSEVYQDQIAAVAFDDLHNLFVVGTEYKKARVVRLAPDGTQKVVSLRQFDGKPLQAEWGFFSVSPSGKRWWLLTTPTTGFSTEGDSFDTLWAFDETGKPLQKWQVPVSAISLQAIGEDQAVWTRPNRFIYYRLNNLQARQVVKPRQSESLFAPRFVGSDGSLFEIENDKAVYRQLNGQRTLLARFQWPNSDFGPEIFDWNSKSGIFAWHYIRPDDPAGKTIGKSVNLIKPTGEVEPLFDTQNVDFGPIEGLSGFEPTDIVVRKGSLLKGDETGAVWMEIGIERSKVLSEYRVVKITRRPRWKVLLERWKESRQ